LRREGEGEKAMKNKTGNSLPKKMPGSVHAQFVRCGKQACKCARGELHGAYYYHFVRVGGRLTKRYLRAHEVEQMQVACTAWREEEKARRELSRGAWRLIREMKAQLRDVLSELNY
jgi:hypothetical protein